MPPAPAQLHEAASIATYRLIYHVPHYRVLRKNVFNGGDWGEAAAYTLSYFIPQGP